MWSTCEPVDVLAVGAHPDDVEMGCGGTILRLVGGGRRVGIVDLTRGELGTRGNAELRAREAAAAAAILGVAFRLNLELEDGHIPVDKTSRLRLIRVIRACRPALILTHSRAGHPDHHRAAQLVEEAAHHSGLIKIETGQERFRPQRILYWTQLYACQNPDLMVDITAYYERKEEALRAFASQLHRRDSREPETYLSRPDFLEQVRAFHRYLGSLAGCSYGEGFLVSKPWLVADLLEP